MYKRQDRDMGQQIKECMPVHEHLAAVLVVIGLVLIVLVRTYQNPMLWYKVQGLTVFITDFCSLLLIRSGDNTFYKVNIVV